jgi:anti-sigma regulatory factor (Ser/Thr protein kinase)
MAPTFGLEDGVAGGLRPGGFRATSFVDVVPADLNEVRPARQRLRAWLADLGLRPAQAYDILLGVGEAVNNAIEHGSHFDARRRVTVEGFAARGEIRVSISDGGHWERDSAASGRGADRGRGLMLMQATSDRVETVRSPMGTRVTLTYLTGSPAGSRAGSPVGSPAAEG